MNNYLKKIKSKKRNAAILLGLVISCVIGLLMMVWSIASDSIIIYTVGLFLTAAAAVASVIIAFIAGGSSAKKVQRRIEALQPTSPNAFENIKLEKVSPEVYIGEDWLAYQKGFDYRFWTKEIIADAKISQQKQSSKQSSTNGVLDIYTKGVPTPEEMPISEANQLQAALTRWLAPAMQEEPAPVSSVQ